MWHIYLVYLSVFLHHHSTSETAVSGSDCFSYLLLCLSLSPEQKNLHGKSAYWIKRKDVPGNACAALKSLLQKALHCPIPKIVFLLLQYCLEILIWDGFLI